MRQVNLPAVALQSPERKVADAVNDLAQLGCKPCLSLFRLAHWLGTYVHYLTYSEPPSVMAICEGQINNNSSSNNLTNNYASNILSKQSNGVLGFWGFGVLGLGFRA